MSKQELLNQIIQLYEQLEKVQNNKSARKIVLMYIKKLELMIKEKEYG